MEQLIKQVVKASAAYPKPEGVFKYGTAGFREKADVLPSTVFRAGVLAGLRALHQKQSTGIMITASHNPEADNGVKLSDPSGGMLDMSWEGYANALAGCETDEELARALKAVIAEQDLVPADSAELGVLLGQDTRKSSPLLAEAAARGIEAAGVAVRAQGLLTTPQLHFLVRATNRGLPCTEHDYYCQLARAFELLLGGLPPAAGPPLLCDAANGVGAPKMLKLLEHLEGNLEVEVRNSGDGPLNDGCGADFVQKEKQLPAGLSPQGDAARRCVSLDGDADRLVYYYLRASHLHLLDGDKIATLFASFICPLIRAVPALGAPKVGVVQTAYANGSSTKYLKETLKLEVACTPTGVKYLHHAAENFDVGIYFEANGHGTVLFKDAFVKAVEKAKESGSTEASTLAAAIQVINQAVGDALSGVLMVEAILRAKGWRLEEWDAEYTDLPSRQLKVKVADRTAIHTINAETQVSSPEALQPLIDASVAEYAGGRAFVRPSGTEDVVRVYAEASTQVAADTLANQVAKHVWKVAGGVGPEP